MANRGNSQRTVRRESRSQILPALQRVQGAKTPLPEFGTHNANFALGRRVAGEQ
jgi:hypothetical protein